MIKDVITEGEGVGAEDRSDALLNLSYGCVKWAQENLLAGSFIGGSDVLRDSDIGSQY